MNSEQLDQSTKYPLSIIIPTYNEENNLKELLPLLKWAEDIIIIDSFSTDKSEQVAHEHKARFIQRAYDNPASQKNYAMGLAQYPYVLILDADERPDDLLCTSIQSKVISNFDDEAYYAYDIHFVHHFLKRRVKYSGWQNDWITRLIHKEKCKYGETQVHETFDISESKKHRLEGAINHFTCQDIEFFMQKMDRYARWSAIDHDPKTKHITLYHLWFKPAFRFFKHFILRLGILDGHTGYIISKIMAHGVFMRYVYMQEKRETKK
jgi:glycosyltransferase involved in cell wall biosynthesis